MQNSQTLRLFLLPYAGANMFAYKALEEHFPPDIVLHALELPGRGKRFNEQLLTNLDDGVADIYRQMRPFLDEPYAIFGHSMGAVLGYIVTTNIIHSGFTAPVHLFFSGRSSLWNINPQPWYLLPSADFWKLVTDLGGVPNSALINDELKVLFEPILRADFRMIQSVEPSPPALRSVDVPITVFLGRNDKLTQASSSWQQNTSRPATTIRLDGGHFYFLNNAALLVRQMLQTLLPTMQKNRTEKLG